VSYEPEWTNGNFWQYLKTRLEDRFNKTDCYCFYSYYGLMGYNEKQVAELANEFKVTSGRISQRIKKVVNYIRHDTELCEMLGSFAESCSKGYRGE
jgi:hypothetical protein